MSVPSAEDVQLLVRLLRRDHEQVTRRAAGRERPIASLAEWAGAHGVSVVLRRALQDPPLRQRGSNAILDALEPRCRREASRSRVLLAALEDLAERFERAGRRFLLLKGPYLADRFYGAVDAREYVDLDILVPQAEREDAIRLLGEAGYRRRSRTLGGTRITAFFVHGLDFVAGDANLDLHWRLSRHPSLRLDDAGLWRRAQSYAIGGRRYGILADEDEIIFAALSLLRDLERGGPKIKNVVDLVQITAALDAELDWVELLEAGRRTGTRGPLVNILALCLEVADAADLAPRLAAALARHAERRVPTRPGPWPMVFAPTALGLGNKMWSARVYDTNPAAWLLWWGASLPFRIAVHHRGRVRTSPSK